MKHATMHELEYDLYQLVYMCISAEQDIKGIRAGERTMVHEKELAGLAKRTMRCCARYERREP
jgi:hypothetical protein